MRSDLSARAGAILVDHCGAPSGGHSAGQPLLVPACRLLQLGGFSPLWRGTMTVGQSITVLTLGVAFTIGAGGIIAGLAVLYFPWLYLTISIALDGGSLRISPAWLATIMAAGGVAAAVGLVKAEQAVAGWLAYRELAKLKAS